MNGEKKEEREEGSFPPVKRDLPVKKPLAGLGLVLWLVVMGLMVYIRVQSYNRQTTHPTQQPSTTNQQQSPATNPNVISLAVGEEKIFSLTTSNQTSQALYQEAGARYGLSTRPPDRVIYWEKVDGSKNGGFNTATAHNSPIPAGEIHFYLPQGESPLDIRVRRTK